MIEDLEPKENPYRDCMEAIAWIEGYNSSCKELTQARKKGKSAEAFIRSIMPMVNLLCLVPMEGQPGSIKKMRFLRKQIQKPSFLRYIRARLGQV